DPGPDPAPGTFLEVPHQRPGRDHPRSQRHLPDAVARLPPGTAVNDAAAAHRRRGHDPRRLPDVPPNLRLLPRPGCPALLRAGAAPRDIWARVARGLRPELGAPNVPAGADRGELSGGGQRHLVSLPGHDRARGTPGVLDGALVSVLGRHLDDGVARDLRPP